MRNKILAFWEFTRPHTIIGTTLSICALYVIALVESNFIALRLPDLFAALVSCLAGNIYIVGLNQIQDIEIDRVNKPYLPIPAGDFSPATAWTIVLFAGVLSVTLAAIQGSYLLPVILISLFLGTLYSLPPVRLKRFPFWASFCIFVVRGLVVNVGIFLYFYDAISGISRLTPPVWALTVFMFGFSLIIAWFKDIPDTEGDRQFRISTFALRLGQKAVFLMGIVLLSILYIGMIIAGFLRLPGVNEPFLIISHLALLLLLWLRSGKVDPAEQASMTSHYHFIWKLFYVEYIAFPAACLLG